jgi:excisionase family DNA binding protein
MSKQTQAKIESPWMTVEEAASYLRLKVSTIYSYLHKRVLKHYKLRGRRIYFKKEDLDRFVMGDNDINLVKSQKQIETEAITNIVTGK